jgi:hypothetical protein
LGVSDPHVEVDLAAQQFGRLALVAVEDGINNQQDSRQLSRPKELIAGDEST